jgi:hypothetical protein
MGSHPATTTGTKKDTRNRVHLRLVSTGGKLGPIQLGPSWDQNALFYALIL